MMVKRDVGDERAIHVKSVTPYTHPGISLRSAILVRPRAFVARLEILGNYPGEGLIRQDNQAPKILP